MESNQLLTQDLHIHTVFSVGDSAVVAEQTLELISAVKHTSIIGISDHFEAITAEFFEEYNEAVRSYHFLVGTEVNGYDWVHEATSLNFDYYVYHCRNIDRDYKGIDVLLATGKPVIIAHPYAFDTNLEKVPENCIIELNNRYIWRFDWYEYLQPYRNKYKFVLSSDAHQPAWLNQNVARYAADMLDIQETILFPHHAHASLQV